MVEFLSWLIACLSALGVVIAGKVVLRWRQGGRMAPAQADHFPNVGGPYVSGSDFAGINPRRVRRDGAAGTPLGHRRSQTSVTLKPSAPPTRLVKDPRNNRLYYLKSSGDIYQVDVAAGTSSFIAGPNSHGLSITQGMTIGPDGAIYLVGNTDVAAGQRRRGPSSKGCCRPVVGSGRCRHGPSPIRRARRLTTIV